MPTQKQIIANQNNAKKSTGPRTEKGKEVVSQNALKHGLRSTQNVIFNESQEEFDLYQQQFLEDLDPQGSTELMIANRIVSLSWRLKRVETFQTEAINKKIDDIDKHDYGEDEYTPQQKIGKMIIDDFKYSKFLDCLLTYERRIENSLYKAMQELERLQNMRKKNQPETQATSPEQRATNPDKQTQFQNPKKCDNSSDKKDLQQKSHLAPSKNQTQSKPFIIPETTAQQVTGRQRTPKHPLCSET